MSRSVIAKWRPSLLFIPEEPTNAHTQHLCEALEFVIKYMAAISFDFRNCRPVELDTGSSESPGKGILCEWWLTAVARLGYASANNVLSA